MREYDVWYRLWGSDGTQWLYVADFDTRAEAQEYADTSDAVTAYDDIRIRCMGGSAE